MSSPIRDVSDTAFWIAYHRKLESDGWQAKGIRYFTEEAQRLGRPFPAPRRLRLLMAVSRLWLSPERQKEMSRFAGYVLLERSDSPSR
jgi:hypothetical protein